MVTVVVPFMCVCVLVCLSVIFCHHVYLDPEIYVRMGSLQQGKNVYNHVFAKYALI